MATHSSIPDWRIPWTEEPDRLQSVGLQRVEMAERLTLPSIQYSFTDTPNVGDTICKANANNNKR